jgi:protein TonB
MADVLIVCVREDEPRAKALAEMFEAAGFSIGGAPSSDSALRSSGAGVVVWSQASIRSRPFLDAAQRVINADKAVVASLIEPPPPSSIGNSPAFDLSDWNGDPNDSALDPLFFAVDRMVNSQRASVGAAAAPPSEYERPTTYDPPPSRTRAPAPAPRPEAAPAPSSGDPLQSESEHWRAIRDSRSPADFMDYLARFGPDGAFAELAELRLKQLTAAAGERPQPRPAARMEPSRREPPPPRQELPPTLRREPPRRADALPPPRALRGQANFDRPPPRRYDRHDVRDPMPRERGGGAARAFFLIAILGGLALAAGLYFGGAFSDLGGSRPQEEASASSNQASDLSDVGSSPPADASENSLSDVAASSVHAAPLSGVVPQTAPATRPPPQVRSTPPPQTRPTAPASAATSADTRTPAPQTSWAGTAPNTPANPARGGPVSLTGSQNAAASPSGPVTLNPAAGPAQQPPQQVVASATPTTVATPPAPPPTVRFAARPSGRQIAALFPERAARAGVGGRVELNCAVDGRFMLACNVASETPPGMGFGRAALAAAGSYRSEPTLSNGRSAIGASTSIVVLFQAPTAAR